jgi:hypothetical protein
MGAEENHKRVLVKVDDLNPIPPDYEAGVCIIEV